MNRALPAVFLAACAADDTSIEQRSCELRHELVFAPGVRVDVLVVVDPRAAALPSYEDNMRGFGRVLDSTSGSIMELHVGVLAGADGRLLTGGCLAVGEGFLVSRGRPDGTTTKNFAGSLDDAFVCMTRIAGDPLVAPTVAMRRALEQNPDFINPGYLQVMFVSTEDESEPAVEAARAYLEALKADPYLLLATAIVPGGSVGWPRLVRGGSQDVLVPIEAADWSAGLPWGQTIVDRYPACLAGPIAGAEQCVASDERRLLAHCPGGVGARPCWWVEPAFYCPSSGQSIHIELDEYPAAATTVSLRCACL